jgi:hypothetical protein
MEDKMISMAEAIQYLREMFSDCENGDGYTYVASYSVDSVDELVEDFEDHFAEKVGFDFETCGFD